MRIVLIATLLFGSLGFSADRWQRQEEISWQKLLANISPSDAVKGVVVASPSRQNPNYYFHWVRDAALVMDVIMQKLRGSSLAPQDRLKFERMFDEYTDFSRSNQQAQALTGLGEPKFEVDGRAFSGPWGRPQDDGAALRALVLIKWAEYLIENGQKAKVLAKLYRPELPAHTLIKADLEFVSHHWRRTSFDLWEETKGHHFYTRVVQAAALSRGAELAQKLGDGGAANWYRKQAALLSAEIEKHWDSKRKIFISERNHEGGLSGKDSGLDVSVLLAVLHTRGVGPISILDRRIESTVNQMRAAFERIYSINQKGLPATLIGRYPEDSYYGGHPWVLATAAFAEYYFLKGDRAEGEKYLERLLIHLPEDGSLAEQMDRDSGFMLSAADLTWSYASVITALEKRKRRLPIFLGWPRQF